MITIIKDSFRHKTKYETIIENNEIYCITDDDKNHKFKLTTDEISVHSNIRNYAIIHKFNYEGDSLP